MRTALAHSRVFGFNLLNSNGYILSGFPDGANAAVIQGGSLPGTKLPTS
jgi:hypothetical protein